MKKLFIISVVFVLLVVLFVMSIPIVNDLTADAVVRDVENIPLPENNELLESISEAGKFTGNGNGMQYFGAVLLRSDLSRDELDKYYSAYRDTEYTCLVKKQETGELDSIIEHGNLAFKSELSRDENYYIVYSWGSGIGIYSALDLRGH